MAIEFNCPHCAFAYRLKDELAGKPAKCKSCGAKITIPHPVTVPAEAPRLSAEELAAKEAAAVAALADEPAPAEKDPSEQVIPVECQFCTHKWTEPLARAGKNTLCPNPECRQRVKIPEAKSDAPINWQQNRSKLPTLAKQNFEKLEGVQDAGDTQLVSGKALTEAGADGIEYEPRSLKRMAMFGFVILALVGGLVFGVVSLFKTRVETKEDKRMQEAVEEFAKTTGALPANEAPAEVQLCSALLSIAAGEHAVRHDDPKKLQEALDHFAKARDTIRKAPPGAARNAVACELAVSLLVLGGTDQQIRDQQRIRWVPEFTIKPRLNERVFTVHEELRQTLTLVQGIEFECKNHLARRLTRALTKHGQAALAVDLLPLTIFAPNEQDEGKALIALEVLRADRDSPHPHPRKVLEELKARGGELMKGNPTPASAQTLFLLLDGDKPKQIISPPPPTDPVPEPSRFAYVGKLLLENQPDEAVKLAQRRSVGGAPEGPVRALTLCADWATDPAPALDAAFGLVKANAGAKGKSVSPYSVLRLSQIAAEKGRHDQAKEFAKLIPDDGLAAWANGSAVQLRVSGSKEKADEGWAELPPADKMPKDLRAGQAWGRLWVARQNTRVAGSQTGAVGAWPTAVGPFGKAGIALGLQDK